MKKLLLSLSLLLCGSSAFAFTQVRQVQISTGSLSRQSGWSNIQAATVTVLDAPNVFSTNTVVAASATIQGGFIGAMTASGTWTSNSAVVNGAINFASATLVAPTFSNAITSGTYQRNSVTITGTATDNSTTTYTGVQTFRNVVQVSTGMGTPATFSVNSSSVVVGASGSPGSIFGTQTNDNATTGYVGEFISTVATNQPYGGVSKAGLYQDIVSVTITPGDWDLSGVATIHIGTCTFVSTDFEFCVGGTSAGSNLTNCTEGVNYIPYVLVFPTTFNTTAISIPPSRLSVSASATYYAKVYISNYNAGVPAVYVRMTARRVR